MEKLKNAVKEIAELVTTFFEAKGDGKITISEWMAIAMKGAKAGTSGAGLVIQIVKDSEVREQLIAVLSDDEKAEEIVQIFRDSLDLPADKVELIIEESFSVALISIANIAESIQKVKDLAEVPEENATEEKSK